MTGEQAALLLELRAKTMRKESERLRCKQDPDEWRRGYADAQENLAVYLEAIAQIIREPDGKPDGKSG